MQNHEAGLAENVCDASITVKTEIPDQSEESTSSTLDTHSRETLRSPNHTKSNKENTTETANQSKSPTKKLKPNTPKTSPSIIKKSNNRDSINKSINDDDEKIDSSDEDKEDLMTKLAVYKQLPNGTFSCELCNQAKESKTTIADQKSLIVRHMLRAHTYCFNYECSYCQDTFKREVWLKNHTEMTHYNADDHTQFYECAKCKHKSINENLLRLHALRKHAAIYRYVCKCCAKCFKTWPAKYEHEKINNKDCKKPRIKPRYVCDKCACILRTKQELVKHLKDVHSEDFYKNGAKPLHNCKDCNKVFMSRKSLLNHLPLHQENEQTGFACDDCGKRLSSRDHLKKHVRVHSGEKPYPCLECGRAFALRTTMRIHALSHSGIKPYVCHHCRLSYSQRSALMIHWKAKHKGLPAPPPIEIHHYFDQDGKVLVPCKKYSTRWYRKKSITSRIRVRAPSELSNTHPVILEQTLSNKMSKRSPVKRKLSDSLEIPESSKTPAKIAKSECTFEVKESQENSLNMKKKSSEPLMYKKLKTGGFGCKVCLEKFSHRYKVKQHIKSKHAPRETFKCADCNKIFKSKYQLTLHSNQHRENSNDYLFCCDKCDYRAKSKHYLKTHEIRKHTNEYNFECDHCNKRFKMKMDLKFHLGTHGQSQHMCDACGRMYTSQDSLYKHRRVVHVNEYKFQCEVCNQKLLTEENLKNHMNSHKNLHSCDECDLKFTKRYYVTRHKKRVHKVEKKNLCPVCGKAFVCMATLRVHYLTHAKVKPYICNVCGFSFTQRSSMMLHWKRKHPDAEGPPPPVILTNFFDTIQSEVHKLVETTPQQPSN